MKATWQERSRDVHERFIRLANDKGSLVSDAEVLHFLSLAICGEAGELANLIKKSWRGDDPDKEQIKDEIADIRIYLEHIARLLQFDLDVACEKKLDTVVERLAVKERLASTPVERCF